MSYTIGIKRRFLPGYKKYDVTRHSWENFRFLIDLVDGSQLVIPGFRTDGIRVYDDFKWHLKLLEQEQRQREQAAELQELYKLRNAQVAEFKTQVSETRMHERAYVAPPAALQAHAAGIEKALPETYEPEEPAPIDPREVEARRRAQQHLQGIFGGNGPAEGLAPRSSLS